MHEYIGDTEALDLFLTGIYQSKPRYYSKNLSYIISQMYAYKAVVLQEALVKCIASKAYNARMFIEASESIRIRHGAFALPAVSNTIHSPQSVNDIRPNRTSITSFEQYFNV